MLCNSSTCQFDENSFAPMKGTCFSGDVLYMPYNFYHHVFSTSDNENKSIAFNFWQTCLFGVDIDSDESAKKLEKNIMKNAIALENLKRIREFEERLRLDFKPWLIEAILYALRLTARYGYSR